MLSLCGGAFALVGGDERCGGVHQNEDTVGQGIDLMDLHVVSTVALLLGRIETKRDSIFNWKMMGRQYYLRQNVHRFQYQLGLVHRGQKVGERRRVVAQLQLGAVGENLLPQSAVGGTNAGQAITGAPHCDDIVLRGNNGALVVAVGFLMEK